MNQITQAEQEVFALAIDGHSISEIQDILHKEECTIKNQRRSILKKLNTLKGYKSRLKPAFSFIHAISYCKFAM